MTRQTTRAASVMTFTAEGTYAGDQIARNRADWRRVMRDARERAGKMGSVFVYPATVDALTGKLISVAPSPMVARYTSVAA